VLAPDFGLRNVDVLLGSRGAPRRHLLNGEHTLAEITLAGPRGVQVIPASSGLQALTEPDTGQRATLTQALDEMRTSFDFVLIDTASGVSDNVLAMLLEAERVIVRDLAGAAPSWTPMHREDSHRRRAATRNRHRRQRRARWRGGGARVSGSSTSRPSVFSDATFAITASMAGDPAVRESCWCSAPSIRPSAAVAREPLLPDPGVRLAGLGRRAATARG